MRAMAGRSNKIYCDHNSQKGELTAMDLQMALLYAVNSWVTESHLNLISNLHYYICQIWYAWSGCFSLFLTADLWSHEKSRDLSLCLSSIDPPRWKQAGTLVILFLHLWMWHACRQRAYWASVIHHNAWFLPAGLLVYLLSLWSLGKQRVQELQATTCDAWNRKAREALSIDLYIAARDGWRKYAGVNDFIHSSVLRVHAEERGRMKINTCVVVCF
jgi:hypothetical protein